MNGFFNRIIVLCAILFVACNTENSPQTEGWYHRPYESVSSYDVVYTTIDGVELTMDFFWFSSMEEPSPVMVFIHGPGDNQTAYDDDVKLMYFHERGYAVATVEYRSADQADFPAGAIDVKAAIRWLRSHTIARHLNPDAIAVWGLSKGATIAAASAFSDVEQWDQVGGREDKNSQANAVIVWNGKFDDVFEFISPDDPPTLIQNTKASDDAAKLHEVLKDNQVSSTEELVESDLADFKNLERIEAFLNENLPKD